MRASISPRTCCGGATGADAIVFWGEDKVRAAPVARPALRRRVAPGAGAARRRRAGRATASPATCRTCRETVMAMLAAASIGAIWSSCSPDFGVQGVLDRFGQIEPKVLFAADGYWYNGKAIDSLAKVAEIAQRLPTLARVVVVPYLADDAGPVRRAERDAPGRFHRALRRARHRVRAVAVRSSALHHVFLGHHRRAQVHRARRRRHAAAAPEGASAALPTSSRATACSTSPPAAG